MVKILDIEGLKVLWSKITSVFAKKADLDNYLPVNNNAIKVYAIKPADDGTNKRMSLTTSEGFTTVGSWGGSEIPNSVIHFSDGDITLNSGENKLVRITSDLYYNQEGSAINGDTVVFYNFHVVGYDKKDQAGFSVEYNDSNKVIITFGDSDTKVSDYPIRFRIGNATYALDLNALAANKLAVRIN